MILKVTRLDGPAASRRVHLEMTTQDAVEMPVLEELFSSVPTFLRARLHKERQGDCADATLWLQWQEESK